MTEDSVKLLRECDTGLKMAIYDLDNIKHGVGKAFMGIKTVIGYMNKYKDAEEFSKKTAENIIKAEEKLLKEIKVYL